MTTCQVCGSKSTVYLCNSHIAELREILENMPPWLKHLEEAALGQVRLGDGGGGRSTARREPFKGDDEVLVKCACKHPEHEGADCLEIDHNPVVTTLLEMDDDGEVIEVETVTVVATPCHCTEYRPVVSQAKLRAQLLAAGRINTRAVDLLDAVRNSLSTWVRHLEESRGIVYVRAGFIGPLRVGHVRRSLTPIPTAALIGYLAEHVQAIACDEGAGECLRDLNDHVDAIEKVINKPIPRLYLGECPTWFEHTRKVCAVELSAPEGTIEITCPGCRRVHKTDRLQLLMMMDLERKKLTIAEILALNARLPESERTPERTLSRWCRPGPKGEPPELKPNGYLRPCSCSHARVHHGKDGCVKCQQLGKRCPKFDGREVINRHSAADETLHKYADVRRLRVERPKRKARATA